ncbi:hypothetical protein ACEUZ9_001136 [Paracoccus litorisediminis]|uniref:hypothetical protein n=1 Tax=Paracoccus litorisediminis TaxID=2006130 RepID=UPI003733F0A6
MRLRSISVLAGFAMVIATIPALADAPMSHTDVWEAVGGQDRSGIAQRAFAKVTTSKSKENSPKHAPKTCALDHENVDGGRLELDFRRHGSDWITLVTVSDREQVFRNYLRDGHIDRLAIERDFRDIQIGRLRFRPDEASYLAVREDMLDRDAFIRYHIIGKDRNAQFTAALDGGVISVRGLLKVKPEAGRMTIYRDCTNQVMGIADKARPGIDAQRSYLEAFEATYPEWVRLRASQDSCFRKPIGSDVDHLIARAARAFHPGIPAVIERRSFRVRHEAIAFDAIAQGRANVFRGGCTDTDLRARRAEATIEKSIRAAELDRE